MTDMTLRRALARQLRFTQRLTDAGAWSGAAEGLLPIIAAHEAEVVGRILDRIDALHRDHDCGLDGEGWRADCLIIFGGGCARRGYCRECGVPDCPTRRLTAEIRGEMSHGWLKAAEAVLALIGGRTEQEVIDSFLTRLGEAVAQFSGDQRLTALAAAIRGEQ